VPGALTPARPPGASSRATDRFLSFDNVSFGYRRTRLVLDCLSHEFAPGATLLLGPNGAGKSTLLALAASAFRPKAGVVRFAGTPAASPTLREYRRRVSWMPQQIRPIPGLSVREQVAYVGWLKGMTRSQAWERSLPALDRVALREHAETRPGRLSGGELRRLGVAQTLVHDAALLLMDEPTAGLDPAQRAGFQQLVQQLAETTTVVVSTHQTDDIDTSYAHVVVLADGRIRFSGSTGAFLASAGDAANGRERVVTAYTRALGSGEPRP